MTPYYIVKDFLMMDYHLGRAFEHMADAASKGDVEENIEQAIFLLNKFLEDSKKEKTKESRIDLMTSLWIKINLDDLLPEIEDRSIVGKHIQMDDFCLDKDGILFGYIDGKVYQMTEPGKISPYVYSQDPECNEFLRLKMP